MSNPRRLRLISLAGVATGALALSACSAGDLAGGSGDGDTTTLTFLVDTSEASTSLAQGLVDAFNASRDDVTITVETRPEGSEGDNLVKTRLATGDMADLFLYNTGSLFQALNPQQNIVPLTEGIDDVDETFLATVSVDDQAYGVPVGTATGGGVFYSKKVYDELGLEVPRTWEDFMANNEKIKAAGIDPVIQTYSDTWTSQLFVLGDFHNVAAVDPDWAEKYTAGEVKYANQPAIDGFRYLEQLSKAGHLNTDFASATLADGLEKLATGKGAHYPMLSFALGGMYEAFPESTDEVGIFGIPGQDADQHGLTVWTGGGIYIPTSTEGAELEAAKDFLEFVASPEGCDAQTEAYAPSGPYFVENCELPADLPLAVQDMLTYFEDGATTPALEFLSPIKGPALEQITVEVGSGIRSADAGAKLYDQDVKKQAQQLGLPGWD